MIENLLKLVSRLPPDGLDVLGRLFSSLLSHDDPMRAVERAAAAVASEKTSDEVIRERLGG